MTFGEKLQKLRTRAGLSQDQLAELLGGLGTVTVTEEGIQFTP